MRLIVCLVFLLPFLAKAHPISLSWASARISENEITVNFKILAEDLFYFHKLKSDERYDFDANALQTAANRHGELIEAYFFITDQNNEQLAAKLIQVNSRSLDKAKINAMNLMKYEIHYKLVYALTESNWEQLTFHQEFTNHGIGIPSLTFLTVYSNDETLVSDVEVSPGNPFVLKASGNNTVQNPSELTSSFFTITQSGVRHELTIPGSVFYNLSYQPVLSRPLLDRVSTYFQNFNPVKINGTLSTPTIQYIQTINTSEITKEGFVYIDLFYPAESVNHTKITWTGFNWQFRWFNTEIFTIDSTYHHTFSRFQTEFLWREKVGVEAEK